VVGDVPAPSGQQWVVEELRLDVLKILVVLVCSGGDPGRRIEGDNVRFWRLLQVAHRTGQQQGVHEGRGLVFIGSERGVETVAAWSVINGR
jgi:hypothetical protein